MFNWIKYKIPVAVLVTGIAFSVSAQNKLLIPDTLSGTTFNLEVQSGTKEFYPGKNTPTYGFNGNFLGPTLLINKGDNITLNVKNKLNVTTTVHWHGFHVAPENDGGPHQMIMAGDTWSPSFTMMNEAATFWYHPHGEGKTEVQVLKGLAGIIIVRDEVEAHLALPRKYGVDDFPLIVQSKSFDVFQQFAIASHSDSVMMVNGTMNPYLEVPAQVVRLRLLNASSDRSYLFGLSNGQSFQLIASDGGLLEAPVSMNRLRLSTGERAEILVNLSGVSVGTQLNLMSYSSELETGIIGADSIGNEMITMDEEYYGNPLNGSDFSVLQLSVISATSQAITTVPTALRSRVKIKEQDAVRTRTIVFSPDTVLSGEMGYVDGPFFLNDKSFHMDSINEFVHLGDVEIWSLVNNTLVAHPFHIHDVEFEVLDINGQQPPAQYQGLKDVMLVQPGDTLRFITQFTDFSNDMVPYMYHCHLLHHEDEGMMGSFLVLDNSGTSIHPVNRDKDFILAPNPSGEQVKLTFQKPGLYHLQITDLLGKSLFVTQLDSKSQLNIDTSEIPNGSYIVSCISEQGTKSVQKLLIQH